MALSARQAGALRNDDRWELFFAHSVLRSFACDDPDIAQRFKDCLEKAKKKAPAEGDGGR
jgi:hypothetical protein